MINENVPVPFSLDAGVDHPSLFLEQDKWALNTGVVTRLDMVNAMAETFYGNENTSIPECGLEDGAYKSWLFAYPDPLDLVYGVGITHGTLGDLIIQIEETKEAAHFQLEDTKSLNYPVYKFVSAVWGADTWDGNGAVASPPTITVDGQDIKLSKKVYGTAIITYIVYRHARRLTVPERGTVENTYSSVAWANWQGGTDILKLEAPEGAEATADSDVACGWDGPVTVEPPEGEPPIPEARPDDNNVRITYCDQVAHTEEDRSGS